MGSTMGKTCAEATADLPRVDCNMETPPEELPGKLPDELPEELPKELPYRFRNGLHTLKQQESFVAELQGLMEHPFVEDGIGFHFHWRKRPERDFMESKDSNKLWDIRANFTRGAVTILYIIIGPDFVWSEDLNTNIPFALPCDVII